MDISKVTWVFFFSAAFSTSMVSPHTDEFLDLLASSQSRRLDDQRASFNNLPGLRLNHHNSQSVLGHLMASSNREPDDDFFDILIKCQVSHLKKIKKNMQNEVGFRSWVCTVVEVT